MIFIVGNRVFRVQVDRELAPRSMQVTVATDGFDDGWTFTEPGWRPLSFGADRDFAYLWSARTLLVLPTSPGDDPESIRVDDDLLQVFRVGSGWLLICESSVRRVLGSDETARLEFGDVIDHVRWGRPQLLVRDVSGADHRIEVRDGQLALVSGPSDVDSH